MARSTVLRSIRSLALACVATSLLMPVLTQACGDKLVVLGGGVPFERVKKTRHPGKVILLAGPDSALRAANEQFRLSTALARAGHSVLVVDSRADMQRALQEQGADLLLLDVDDALQVRDALGAGPRVPSVLSVVYDSTPTALASAQQQMLCVAEATKRKSRNILRTVELVMATRDRGVPIDCANSAVQVRS